MGSAHCAMLSNGKGPTKHLQKFKYSLQEFPDILNKLFSLRNLQGKLYSEKKKKNIKTYGCYLIVQSLLRHE
jgi:hypothetical protein